MAKNGVERRAQFVAQSDELAALCFVGCLRCLFGLLQLGVGTFVRLNLVHHQEVGSKWRVSSSATRAAFLRQHEQPCRYAGDKMMRMKNTVHSASTPADRGGFVRVELQSGTTSSESTAPIKHRQKAKVRRGNAPT